MEQENKGNEEIKPVKLSMAATVALVIGLIVMVFVVVVTIRGCSIQKVEKPVQTEQYTEPQSTRVPETTSNVEIFESISPESQPSSVGMVTAPTDGSISENEPSSNEEQFIVPSNDSFVEVADPALSNEISSYGMVIGKHTYKRNNSYVYGVNISIIVNDQSVSAEYFCPRNTFDSLKSGDSLNVSYRVDSNGSISISTIAFS